MRAQDHIALEADVEVCRWVARSSEYSEYPKFPEYPEYRDYYEHLKHPHSATCLEHPKYPK